MLKTPFADTRATFMRLLDVAMLCKAQIHADYMQLQQSCAIAPAASIQDGANTFWCLRIHPLIRSADFQPIVTSCSARLSMHSVIATLKTRLDQYCMIAKDQIVNFSPVFSRKMQKNKVCCDNALVYTKARCL